MIVKEFQSAILGVYKTKEEELKEFKPNEIKKEEGLEASEASEGDGISNFDAS